MVTEVAYQKIFVRKYDKLKYGGTFVKYWYAIIGSGVLNLQNLTNCRFSMLLVLAFIIERYHVTIIS